MTKHKFNFQALLFAGLIFILVLTFGTKVFAATNPGRHIGVDVFWDENGQQVDSNFDLLLPNPTIVQNPTVTLTTSLTSINSGSSSTLTWSPKNATSCTSSNSDFHPNNIYGTQPVSPTVDTTYYINCIGADGTTPANTSVKITVTPPVAPPAPLITSFYASPSVVTLGAPSTLIWTSINTDQCTSADFNTSNSINGSAPISPSTAPTTTYHLTCYNSAGALVDATADVTVNNIPPPLVPPTVTLVANPTTITSGSSSTLTWTSTNTNICSAVNFVVSGLNGTQAISPTTTTAYSITCYGAEGTTPASASVSVAVIANPVIIETAEIRSGFVNPNLASYDDQITGAWNTLFQPFTGNAQPSAITISVNSWARSSIMANINHLFSNSFGINGAGGSGCTDSSSKPANTCGAYYIILKGQIQNVITGGFHANSPIDDNINQVNFPAGFFDSAPTVVISRNYAGQGNDQMSKVFNVTKDGFQYAGDDSVATDCSYQKKTGETAEETYFNYDPYNGGWVTYTYDVTVPVANPCGMYWIAVKGDVTDALRSGTGLNGGYRTSNMSIGLNDNLGVVPWNNFTPKAVTASYSWTSQDQDIFKIFNLTSSSFSYFFQYYDFGISFNDQPIYWLATNGNFKINKYSNGNLGVVYQ